DDVADREVELARVHQRKHRARPGIGLHATLDAGALDRPRDGGADVVADRALLPASEAEDLRAGQRRTGEGHQQQEMLRHPSSSGGLLTASAPYHGAPAARDAAFHCWPTCTLRSAAWPRSTAARQRARPASRVSGSPTRSPCPPKAWATCSNRRSGPTRRAWYSSAWRAFPSG